MSVDEIKNKMMPILRKYGVRRASIFGSAVRREMKESSDVDILVEIDRDISLLDSVESKLELEEVLGKRVNFVEFDTIKPRPGERILREQVVILNG